MSREKKNPLGKPKDYIRVILLLGILISLSTSQVVEYFVNEVYSLFRKISLILSSSSKHSSWSCSLFPGIVSMCISSIQITKRERNFLSNHSIDILSFLAKVEDPSKL
jgi:hypothetical protein